AHELNQPLTAVANYLEAARDLLSTPGPETVKIVQDALSAASVQSVRAGQIIRRLRDYVSHGEIETRPTQLAPLVSDAASLAKIGLAGPLPRIIESIDDDTGVVMADGVQLRQVLINLVRNAIEAMGDMSNPQIWISACRHGDNEILVEVRDNGPGFQLQDGEDVFQPFSSSKATGMGLGLSICQTIIDGHGGKIWTLLPTGGGAIFRFTLQKACIGEGV
ncbi:MAG: ATP-binding protein, partial [Henriciella sp.]|nr:ATP-binding protein [Henriciella sp.]